MQVGEIDRVTRGRGAICAGVGDGMTQGGGARVFLQHRREVITERAVIETRLAQDAPGQNVEVELRRNSQVAILRQDGVRERGVIEEAVEGFSRP